MADTNVQCIYTANVDHRESNIWHGGNASTRSAIASISDTRLARYISHRASRRDKRQRKWKEEKEKEKRRASDYSIAEYSINGREDSGGVAIERSLRAMIRENLLEESHLEEARPARHISNDMPATTTATTILGGREERPHLVWISASQSVARVPRATHPSFLFSSYTNYNRNDRNV